MLPPPLLLNPSIERRIPVPPPDKYSTARQRYSVPVNVTDFQGKRTLFASDGRPSSYLTSREEDVDRPSRPKRFRMTFFLQSEISPVSNSVQRYSILAAVLPPLA